MKSNQIRIRFWVGGLVVVVLLIGMLANHYGARKTASVDIPATPAAAHETAPEPTKTSIPEVKPAVEATVQTEAPTGVVIKNETGQFTYGHVSDSKKITFVSEEEVRRLQEAGKNAAGIQTQQN